MYVDYNNKLPNINDIYEKYNIGRWLYNQKLAYKNKELSGEKHILLDKINSNWK